MDKLQTAKACAERMFDDDQASRDLGMSLRVVEPGAAEVTMTITQSMVNGHDICHGGYIFMVADSAFAFACNSYDDVTVAAGADINFLCAAVLGDELKAVARETQRGRRAGVYDVDVRNQDNRLVAVFRGRSMALGRPILGE